MSSRAPRHWASIASMIAWTDGSKSAAISELTIQAFINNSKGRWMIHKPEELHTTDLYTKSQVSISWQSELDVHWVVRIPEVDFGYCVKITGHQGNILRVPISRPTKFFYWYIGGYHEVEIKTNIPSRNVWARRVTSTDPWTMPREKLS
jgi:hypothetical protein